MCPKKKNDANGNFKHEQFEANQKIFHAMRNGILYRSVDGIRWELETDPDVSVIPEGTSRITQPK